jgi:hypothetical protein
MARLSYLPPYERTMSGRTVYTGTLTYQGTVPTIELFWPVCDSFRKNDAGNRLTAHRYMIMRDLNWLITGPGICPYDKHL